MDKDFGNNLVTFNDTLQEILQRCGYVCDTVVGYQTSGGYYSNILSTDFPIINVGPSGGNDSVVRQSFPIFVFNINDRISFNINACFSCAGAVLEIYSVDFVNGNLEIKLFPSLNSIVPGLTNEEYEEMLILLINCVPTTFTYEENIAPPFRNAGIITKPLIGLPQVFYISIFFAGQCYNYPEQIPLP